jgi:hypothetical protein
MTEEQRQERARKLKAAAISEGERRRRDLHRKFKDAPIPPRAQDRILLMSGRRRKPKPFTWRTRVQLMLWCALRFLGV